MDRSTSRVRFVEGDGSKVYPWLDIKPDCRKHTGGDWFSHLLSLSMGGKVLHGSNTSATCEVICKSIDANGTEPGLGLIKWDPKVKPLSPIGREIADQHYTHHAYKGTVTSSGNVMAYESGAWEPSLRARARATSLLAAGIHAHGCNRQDAIRTVSIIASDDIDEEAVESTLLPASHLKREMTVISKANHRVFSKGSLQSSIMWDDSQLSLTANLNSVAFDWGRVTAIARYVAEANIQTCPSFRGYAMGRGIPYYIVRNAWAYIDETDYQLLPERFGKVPKIDIARYQIPSLRGAFVNHEQDILIAVTRSLDSLAIIPDSDTFRAYSNLYKEAQERRNNYRKVRAVDVDNFRVLPPVEHTLTAHTSSELIARSIAPRKALISAIATRRAHDPRVAKVIDAYFEAVKEGTSLDSVLDRATRVVLDRGSWLLARTIAEQDPTTIIYPAYCDTEDEQVDMAMKLSKMKTMMFGYPTHLSVDPLFSPTTLIALRPYTIDLLNASANTEPAAGITQQTLASQAMRETAEVYGKIGRLADKHLGRINTEVSDVYQGVADRVLDHPDHRVVQNGVNLAFTAYALKWLSISRCMNKTTGYIDGADPRACYITKCVDALSSRLGYKAPELKRLRYTGSFQLAEELDLSGMVPYNVSQAAEYATRVMDEVVGNLMLDRGYDPPEGLYPAVFDGVDIPGSPAYNTQCMEDAEAAAFIEAMFKEAEEEREKSKVSDYEATLNTYPTAGLAEKYARVNGYASFEKAYEDLGYLASYADESKFVQDARIKLSLAAAGSEAGKKRKKRGYQSLI